MASPLLEQRAAHAASSCRPGRPWSTAIPVGWRRSCRTSLHQRREVHPPRAARSCVRWTARPTRPCVERARQRHRHRSRVAARDLRPVRAGRAVDRSRRGRARPRPGDSSKSLVDLLHGGTVAAQSDGPATAASSSCGFRARAGGRRWPSATRRDAAARRPGIASSWSTTTSTPPTARRRSRRSWARDRRRARRRRGALGRREFKPDDRRCSTSACR